MIANRKVLIFSVFCIGTFSVLAKEASWETLFDGKSLAGWEVRGGVAQYRVEDGCIVGKTVEGSPNTFLCTMKEYGDFILEFDVRCDPKLNSGVQIRSHIYYHDTVFPIWRDGQRIDNKHKAGDVYGYQVEIASAETGTSGGVWDEARKGMWLDATSQDPVASKAFNNGEWNHYRIECIGPRIRTFINDIPCADFVDTSDVSGFIGLQVHSVSRGLTAEVRWKNLRIKDLGRHVWKPLFDGQTLDGWHTLPGGSWQVKNGILIGSSLATETKHGLLVSDEVFGDFVASVRFKAVKGNSGLYFRVEESGDAVGVHGFQAEIDGANDVGGLYETAGRAWVIQPKPEEVATWFKPGDWNTMTVYARGQDIVVHVNGYKTAELKNDPGRLEGRLALQLHGNQDMEVQFRDVSILVRGKVSEPFNGKDLDNWIAKPGSGKENLWVVGIPEMNKDNPKQLIAKNGVGAMINLTKEHGQSQDFYSRQTFGSGRFEVEVMVPQGSNSGVYLMGEYEVQVLDSFGRERMGSGDMGAIYGAAPPPFNANTPPGTWQKYVIDWQTPVFNDKPEKIKNARFIRVQLNGQMLHESLVMPNQTPGGVDGREKPVGPLMFQGNHGSVAYRNIIVTEW
ncbi:MAG: DUF1080 domain-containing protein [Sedimentisphaerales bacterium]|nr:DUF1080 domain-containing protein [Sedimentisphaerales bacterium]